MSISYAYVPAARRRVSLIVILAGATGSGKSLTALLLARGLVGGRQNDHKIKFIDSESGRGLFYAPAEGEKPADFSFGFMYGELHAPFDPEAYGKAIEAADTPDTEVIIVDSFSHVWNGDGGCDDIHEAVLDRMAGNDFGKRTALSVGAWKEPKLRHKRLVSRMLQCKAHLIICLRAEEKLRMEQIVNEQGFKKTVITAAKDLPVGERWKPICEGKFPYEATISILFSPDKPGYPIPLKLMEQNRAAVPLDRQMGEETGRKLAAWARGGAPATQKPAQEVQKQADLPQSQAQGVNTGPLIIEGAKRAKMGVVELQGWWQLLTPDEKQALKTEKEAWKTTALGVDQASS